jgi:hypothetical protein
MLGRQEICFTREDFLFVKNRADISFGYDDSIALGAFSEPLFRKYGAQTVESIDASDYEGASVIHDFNRPISRDLCGRFTLFVECGSIEHIYDVPRTIDNMSKLVADGGTILIVNLTNGYAGHGFYQFSPELFYSVFCEANGFSDTSICLIDLYDVGKWYYIRNPKLMGCRNVIAQGRPYFIFCVTRKVASKSPICAQQSDYETVEWKTQGHRHIGEHGRSIFSKLRPIVNPFLFQNVRSVYHARRSLRAFKKSAIRFDPDRISSEEFARVEQHGRP